MLCRSGITAPFINLCRFKIWTTADTICDPESDFLDVIAEGSVAYRDSGNKSLEAEKVE
jgi:hypothetical protein